MSYKVKPEVTILDYREIIYIPVGTNYQTTEFGG